MCDNGEIRRSTGRHFLPGVLVMIGAVLLLEGALPRLEGWLLLALDLVMVSLGYGLALRIGRRFVRKLSWVRGLAAGMWAPLIAMVGFISLRGSELITPASTLSIVAGSAVVMFSAGALSAGTMFLRRRKHEPEIGAPDALPGETLEQWFRRVEREAEKAMRRVTRRLRSSFGAGSALEPGQYRSER